MNNTVINSMLNHRSIRRFTDRQVSEEILEQILWAGIRQATVGNLQFHTLIIADRTARLHRNLLRSSIRLVEASNSGETG